MLHAETTWRRLGTLWIGLCLLLAAVLAWQLPHSRINTSLMDLLPHESRSDLDPALQQGLLQQLDRQLVWLLSLPAGQDGRAAATFWAQQLGELPALSRIKGYQPELAPAWQRYLHELAWQRLDPASRARLAGGAEGWSQWVLGQIYSPFGGVSRAEWQSDPLLLTRAGVLAEARGPMQLKEGWLVSRDDAGRDWYMVRAELDLSAFDIQRNQALLSELTGAEQRLVEAYPGAELLRRGTLFYSQHASQLAQQDISTIGLGSMVGVILLIWGVFRSTRALLLSLLPIGVGLMWGLGTVLILFGEIHLFTLVISSSLIGIAIDYAIHFLCERRLHGDDETPHQTRLKLLPSLSLAVLTTLIGYGLLWFAPFPGLQQLAVCALAGLFSAFITVLCLFPRWTGPLPTRALWGQRWLQGWLLAWQQRPLLRIGLPLCCLLLAALGISRLQVDDDIRRLQPLPVALQGQEQRIQALTGQQGGMQGLLVTGADGEQALQRLERLDGRLAELQQRGALQDFVSLARWLPSLARQQEDAAAIRTLLPEVVSRLKAAGLPLQPPVREPHWLTPAAWLASPVSEGSRLLWHALADGRVAIWVPLVGVADEGALTALAAAESGVYWQDQRSQWSQLFAHYRIKLAELLSVAIALVALLLWRRMGAARAARVLLVNLIALAMGLALLAACGQPLTLFGVLALSLIFGIGIDYGLFFAHSGNEAARQSSTLLAILLANLTTQLAFGLLALSHTPAIAGFGLVLSGGIFTAFLLSPLVLDRVRPQLPGPHGREPTSS
ncbi:MMPL family transporter [Aeromonas dhakensis]|uniref:MMPL family transporter n=1 Tax=Aeromonas dhakensis TaxID=196024 RepID=UPI0020B1C9F6|nr:MMPL family transporter [Aeromonas dhakensis]MDD9306223.1 MMPL family transporter [Aeromonas hydrophila]WPS56430.1 MMPL family transporter [Aeromonas dhakensis]WRT73979.1 MMPL family transporter [Aeromonas dhakensis]CAD7492525.1 membrane protein [Aeromonas dhakensis]CAD7504552.1 membrane protein [Aeromonas dhakensis]